MTKIKPNRFNKDQQLENRPYMPSPDQYVASLPGAEVAPEPELPRRYRVPRSYRRRVWPKAFAGLLLLLGLAAVAYVAYIAIIVAKISTQPLQIGGLASDSDGRVNVLVLGVGDPGHAGEGLSDTMMVMSLDTRTKRVA